MRHHIEATLVQFEHDFETSLAFTRDLAFDKQRKRMSYARTGQAEARGLGVQPGQANFERVRAGLPQCIGNVTVQRVVQDRGRRRASGCRRGRLVVTCCPGSDAL